jgi:hypothetical protein
VQVSSSFLMIRLVCTPAAILEAPHGFQKLSDAELLSAVLPHPAREKRATTITIHAPSAFAEPLPPWTECLIDERPRFCIVWRT